MIYTVAVMFIFSFVIILRKYRNRYSLALAAMIFFLNFSILTSLIYIMKVGNYQYPSLRLFSFDYKGVMALAKLKIPFYVILRLRNIAFGGYLACLPLFLYDYDTTRKRLVKTMVLGMLLPIFFCVFYDPVTKLNIFAYLHSGAGGAYERKLAVMKGLNIFNNIWIVLYLIYPIARMAGLMKKCKSAIKKYQLLSLMVSVTILNILCAYIFIVGPFAQNLNSMSANAFLGFPEETPRYEYNLIPILAFAAVNVMLILLFKFHGLDQVDFFREQMLKHSVVQPTKNIRNIMHTYKNEMLSVNVIAKQLAMNNDPQKQKYLIGRLEKISQDYLDNITYIMNMLKKQSPVTVCNNAIECVEHAARAACTDSSIKINKIYETEGWAYFEKSALEKSLVNIINNSVEAIHMANRTDGMIDISVYDEYEWLIIKVTDNGVGIPRKEQRHIWSTFYSTKSSAKNWGVGLNYVYRMIKAMNGFVYVQSEVNKFTTIQIALQNKQIN